MENKVNNSRNKSMPEKLKNEIKLVTKWKIFPFVINNGAIGLSETGYKPINSKITDFGKYELIITGDSPVVVIWKNSTIIYQKNKGTTDPQTKITTGQDQFYTKKYQVGDYWEAALIEDISGVDFSTLVSNNIYKTITTKRSYKLVLTTQRLTVNDYLQFFVVFNDNNENIGGDTIQDRQLLYLSEVVNSYDKDTGKFVAQTLTLSSLNDKLQASGQTTLGFIQYASPGSGYAFPEVNKGVVTLNRDLMRDIGVTFAHRQSYGMELLSSCYYYGRPIIQGQKPQQIDSKEIFEQKIYAPRRLFIAGNNQYSNTDVKNNGGLFAGINDVISTNSHPETTFYNIMDAQPTGYQNFKDWKDWISSSVGILPDAAVKKDFKGILKFDNSKAIASNGSKIDEAKVFWDSLWNIENISGNYNVEMSSYYRFKNPDNQTLIGSPTFDYSKIKQKFMSSILNFNGTIFSHLLQMPYDSKQWIPFAFSNIPVIGKYLNELDLGIPFGFILGQDSKQYQKMSYFNGFMSAFFTNALANIVGKDGLIPLNLFINNSENEIGKLLGANVSTTALLMKLTDRINIYPWTLDGKKLSSPEQISSVNLSQKYNNKVYIMAEDTEFLDIASPLTNKDNDCQWNPTPDGILPGEKYGYIIEYITTQSLHQGEERHTFYSDNPIANNVNDLNELSVAQYRFNNNALFTGNMFNWTTQYKTNHDEYKETEETTFDYPGSILPPDPMNIVKDVIFIPKNNVVDKTLSLQRLFKVSNNVLVYSNSDWLNNISNNIIPLEIDFNFQSLLDPKLLINNFNDLKRFYKSITVYINWNYETLQHTNTSEVDSYINTSETFVGNKTQNYVFNMDLNNLNYYKDNKLFVLKNDNYEIHKGTAGGGSGSATTAYGGVGVIGKEVNNTNNLYSLLNTSIFGNQTENPFGIPTYTKSYKSDMYLGFQSTTANDLNFKIQLFPLYEYINCNMYYISKPVVERWLIRQLDKYMIKITKITLNAR